MTPLCFSLTSTTQNGVFHENYLLKFKDSKIFKISNITLTLVVVNYGFKTSLTFKKTKKLFIYKNLKLFIYKNLNVHSL